MSDQTTKPDTASDGAGGLRLVVGPGPLAEVLPEALVRLAEEKAQTRSTAVRLAVPPPPTGIVFLLWSGKHSAWWRPDARGYAPDIAEAGRYQEAEAVRRVVQSAMCGDREQVTCMVAAPDNWAGPADV